MPTEIENVRAEGIRLVKLRGTIDDGFDPELFGTVVESVVVIDLDGVTRVTSFGVREWIRGLAKLGTSEYYFVRCRPAMVSQLNMVSGFGGTGVLVSLYAPYLCGDCDEEFEVLHDLRTSYELLTQPAIEHAPCPKCGASAELDDLRESFFSFAASKPPPTVPAQVARIIDGGTASTEGAPLRVRKEVTTDLTALWLNGPIDAATRFKRTIDGLEGLVYVVMEGVTALTADGARHLGTFTKIEDASAALVRVTAPIAKACAQSSEKLPPIQSLLLDLPCGHCGALRRSDVWRSGGELARKPFDRACLACDHDGFAPPTPELAQVLACLDARDLPAVAAAYLEQNRFAPALSRAPAPPKQRRFDVIRKLASGGMAEVFLARQLGPEGFTKDVVLKRILPNLAQSTEFVDMFLREARLAARIAHPNVVQILDLGFDGEQYFIAMEYLKGLDLRSAMTALHRSARLMPVGIACRIVADVCAGLHAAHTCVDETGALLGIVHRDVSPRNILISEAGAVKLTDFGIAKHVRDDDQVESTEPGVFRGKVSYAAPERYTGAKLDPRVDVFAAGVVLYECLAGMRPFPASATETPSFTLESVAKVGTIRGGIPAEIDDIVFKAIDPDPAQRFQSARALQLALESVLADLKRPYSSTQIAQWLTGLDQPLVEPASGSSSGSGARRVQEPEHATVSAPEGDRVRALQQTRQQMAEISKRMGSLVDKRKDRGST